MSYGKLCDVCTNQNIFRTQHSLYQCVLYDQCKEETLLYVQFNQTCVFTVPYYNDTGMLVEVENCTVYQFYIIDRTGAKKCVDSCEDPYLGYQFTNPIEGN